MAAVDNDIPINLEKRRNSTGNRSIQIGETTKAIVPNYLRSSIGTCHDFCKHGIKPNFQAQSRLLLSQKQDQNNVTVSPEEWTEENNRGRKASASAKPVPVTARKQPAELKKWKPCGRNTSSLQSAMKQPNRTFLKSTCNIQISPNEDVNDVRTPKTNKPNSFQPSSSSSRSSVKAPSARSRTSKSSQKKVSQLETKKVVEKSETEKTSKENVPEKIIHAIEPTDRNQIEGLPQENQTEALAEDGRCCTALKSSSNQDPEVDSAAVKKSKVTRGRRVNLEEKDCSPRKLKFRRTEVLEVQNGNAGPVGKNSRRVQSDGEFTHYKTQTVRDALQHPAVAQKNKNPGLMNSVIEETASKLVQVRKSKVKALVGAFENVMKIQDSDSLRTSTTF